MSFSSFYSKVCSVWRQCADFSYGFHVPWQPCATVATRKCAVLQRQSSCMTQQGVQCSSKERLTFAEAESPLLNLSSMPKMETVWPIKPFEVGRPSRCPQNGFWVSKKQSNIYQCSCGSREAGDNSGTVGEGGSTPDGSLVRHWTTCRQGTSHTHSHSNDNLESMFLRCGRKRRKPKHGEHANYTDSTYLELKQGDSRCEMEEILLFSP